MRRSRPLLITLSLLAALGFTACSGAPLVEIGDATDAPEKAIPAGRVMTNLSAYMDGEKAKVKVELTNRRGEAPNGKLRVFVLGMAQEIEIQVNPRYRAEVEGMELGDDFIAYVTLGESNGALVLQVE